MSIVADAADGADGVMESILTYGRYPDSLWPLRSQPPLAAEDDLIPRVRRKVCARRSRPVSARGLFGQPEPTLLVPLFNVFAGVVQIQEAVAAEALEPNRGEPGRANAYHTHGLAKESEVGR
jgi:hypothetical protein